MYTYNRTKCINFSPRTLFDVVAHDWITSNKIFNQRKNDSIKKSLNKLTQTSQIFVTAQTIRIRSIEQSAIFVLAFFRYFFLDRCHRHMWSAVHELKKINFESNVVPHSYWPPIRCADTMTSQSEMRVDFDLGSNYRMINLWSSFNQQSDLFHIRGLQ